MATVPTQPVLRALTATARGMVDHTMTRAARQAFDELMGAVGRAGLMPQVATCMAFSPDQPRSADDRDCRYVAGVLFGHALHLQQGKAVEPEVSLSGSLAWHTVAPGRFAVFTHHGPYHTLFQTWLSIYSDWLPTSGETLRDAVPMEICLNDASITPPEDLVTEVWIPVA